MDGTDNEPLEDKFPILNIEVMTRRTTELLPSLHQRLIQSPPCSLIPMLTVQKLHHQLQRNSFPHQSADDFFQNAARHVDHVETEFTLSRRRVFVRRLPIKMP